MKHHLSPLRNLNHSTQYFLPGHPGSFPERLRFDLAETKLIADHEPLAPEREADFVRHMPVHV